MIINMLKRLYVHNYRCFENFEFKQKSSSALLLGKNGAGKSTLLNVLKIFQSIGRGTNRLSSLISPSDFSLGRKEVPINFEVEIEIDQKSFKYSLSLELPDGFKELRVKEEKLEQGERLIFMRDSANVVLHRADGGESQFFMDWHMIALPIIREPSSSLDKLITWFDELVLLAPIPSLINGYTDSFSLSPKENGSNFSDWLSGVLARYPASYATIIEHLKETMPDLMDFRFEQLGKDSKNLFVRFKSESKKIEFPFDVLSDGEKCFFICAVVLAAQENYGPLFCFWDEPDNYLSLSEVGHFIVSLRQGFGGNGQILMTSHNEEAIRRFSNENTWVMSRKSHLEPTVIRLLDEINPPKGVVESLIVGDI